MFVPFRPAMAAGNLHASAKPKQCSISSNIQQYRRVCLVGQQFATTRHQKQLRRMPELAIPRVNERNIFSFAEDCSLFLYFTILTTQTTRLELELCKRKCVFGDAWCAVSGVTWTLSKRWSLHDSSWVEKVAFIKFSWKVQIPEWLTQSCGVCGYSPWN